MRRHLFPVDPLRVDLLKVRDLGAFEEFECQHFGRRERPVHDRYLDLRILGEVSGKGLRVLPFLDIVQLFADNAGEFGVNDVEVDAAVEDLEDLDDEAERPDIGRDHLFDAGILDLDRDAFAAFEVRAMHLAERGRGDGCLVERGKDLLRRTDLLNDALHDVRNVRGRDLVLELGKLVRILFREDVHARGQELSDLDEYAAHLDHSLAQHKRVIGVKLLEPFFSMGRGGEGVSEREELIAQKYPEKKDNAFNEPASVVEDLHA